MPLGVHDSNPPPVNAIAANAAEVTPSTSLSAEMASNAARSSMWPGTGCCSSMPSIEGSADNALSTSTSSSVVVLAGRSTVRDVIPDGDRSFGLHLYIRLRGRVRSHDDGGQARNVPRLITKLPGAH